MDRSGDRGGGAAAEGPVVAKVRFHWNPASIGMPGRWRTYVCADREEARRRVAELRAAGGDPLLQELMRGPLLRCHVLVDRGGRLVTAVQQRSEPAAETPLTWPPGAGVRTRSITVPLDGELVERITVLLRRLGWVGFVGLMFIVGADGVPRLVDFNGRIPMSFQQPSPPVRPFRTYGPGSRPAGRSAPPQPSGPGCGTSGSGVTCAGPWPRAAGAEPPT